MKYYKNLNFYILLVAILLMAGCGCNRGQIVYKNCPSPEMMTDAYQSCMNESRSDLKRYCARYVKDLLCEKSIIKARK